jgi:hypothetical protein
MKRALVLAALTVVLGLGSLQAASGPPVVVRLAPLDTNSNSFYFRGPVGLRYALAISNPADETVTLRRLDLRSEGGGAYIVRANSTPMKLQVAPRSNATIAINAWGRSRGGEFRSDEPVVIVGRAYFDSPRGPFVKLFQETVMPNP